MRHGILTPFGAIMTALALSGTSVIAQDMSESGVDAQDLVSPGIAIEDPQTGMIGQIQAWLFYSSEYGATGGASSKLNFPASEGRWASIGTEIAERRQSLKLAYHQDEAFGTAAAFDMTLRGSHQEPRTTLPFESSSVGLQGKLTWPQNGNAQLATYLGTAENRIYNPDASLSTLLLSDVRRNQRTYAGVEYKHAFQGNGGSLSKLQYTLGAEAAANSTGESQLRGQAGLLAGGANESGAVNWRADLRAGSIGTANGASSIGERFILGGGTMRGFAYGGFGPHDGTQALGGNSFAVARFDVQFPRAFGESAWLMPGLHADFGSLWGLDTTGAGLVDDSAKLRGSVGVTLSAKMQSGWVSLSLSNPVISEASDESQLLQLGLYTKF